MEAMQMCEVMEGYGMEVRKARKQHKCCECRGTINAGEQYHYHHGVADGRGVGYKVCPDCQAMRVEIEKNTAHYDDLLPFEGLFESAVEDEKLAKRMAATMAKRGAKVPEWLAKEIGI
jgi:hypothetical protein